jgi:hypothetical protein
MNRLTMLSAMLALSFCVADPAVSDEAGKDPIHPALIGLEMKFKSLLKNSCPDATVAIARDKEDELVVQYRTQKFTVHGTDRLGNYNEKPHEKLGPNRRGFLLRVTVQKGSYDGPLAIPQEFSEPYWKTFLAEHPIRGGAADMEYLWVRLSHGAGADEQLLAKIKKTVADFAAGTRK